MKAIVYHKYGLPDALELEEFVICLFVFIFIRHLRFSICYDIKI